MFSCSEFSDVIVFRRTLGAVGCSWYAETTTDADVAVYARQILSATGLNGSANLQVRKSHTGVRLLEINPRFSSLASARAVAGFRDAEWSVCQSLGLPLERPGTQYRDVRFQRFFHELVDVGDGYHAVRQWSPRTSAC